MYIFVGCGDELYQIRYDVPTGSTTLDPQYAVEGTSKIVIANTYEGLMRKTSDGKIVPLGAKEYTVSEDGLVYTFTLNEDMNWSDGSPVVADDFVFTFERILNPEGACPYSKEFLGIKNASRVLNGSMQYNQLGVKAINDVTLQFTLEEPDSMFTEKLTQTYAVPTKRSYFEETKGKYGMDDDHIVSNGPFRVTVWDNSQYIILKQDSDYYDKSSLKVAGMNIHIGRKEDKLQLISEDKADAFAASYKEVVAADKKAISYEGFNNKIWTVMRNPNSKIAELGLTASDIATVLHGEEITEALPDNMVKAYRLLPESSKVGDLSYTKNSEVFLKKGTYQNVSSEIERATMIVYDSESITPICDYISQMLQKHFSVYVDIEYLSPSEVSSRILKGDYDIAIMPMVPETSSPSSILYDFLERGNLESLGLSELSGYSYLMKQADENNPQKTIKTYQLIEQAIIDSGVVAPAFSETDYFISSSRVSGIEFYPYSGIIYIKNAYSK